MNKRKVNNIFVTAGAGGVGGFTLQLLKYWRSSYPQDE
jgi:NADPH:quinone reductase-like Zn-dependent oxidoreductase